MVLIKYSGKYVKIYFNMKITFSGISLRPVIRCLVVPLRSKLMASSQHRIELEISLVSSRN